MNTAGCDVWVYVEHLQGVVAGHTYELLGKGRDLAGATGGRLLAILAGSAVEPLAGTLGAADAVLYVDDPRLGEFTPEAHAAVLGALAGQHGPRLVLVGATSMGMDLAGLLATALDAPVAVNCRDVRIEDDTVVVTSQVCGGKLLCEAEVAGAPAILTVLAGVHPAEAGTAERLPDVQRLALPVPLDGLRTRVTRMLQPEAGDVDITKAPVLVAVGRGIQRQDNLALAEELAGLLGGAVCASRPVVDQGWLPLSRQVGKSGMIVKPRLYLALGISGASEHTEGMKDSELVMAINADPKAPIFEVADYGVAADMFDIIPALIGALRARKGLAA